MTEELPPPPIPADTDIRDLDGFLLNTERLLASELWALSSGAEFKAAVGLWCRSWKQTPPGSLPDDDRVLAAFSGAGAAWRKVRDMALRGFIKCSDGRLYHPEIAQQARKQFVQSRRLADLHDTEWSRARIRVFERDGYSCRYCGSLDDLQCDHVIPKSRGGGDDDDNLVAACGQCNRSKGARTPSEWRQ